MHVHACADVSGIEKLTPASWRKLAAQWRSCGLLLHPPRVHPQGRPITPVYAMAPNVQRLPAVAGLYGAGYGASYLPIAAPASTATLAALQKNAAMAAAYGGYAGYVPQAFPATAFQVPLHDVYQTYWRSRPALSRRGINRRKERIYEEPVPFSRFPAS